MFLSGKKKLGVVRILLFVGVVLLITGFVLSFGNGFDEANTKVSLLGLLFFLLGLAAYLVRRGSWHE